MSNKINNDKTVNKKKAGKKVQVWVKKETLQYEQELRTLQIELLKFQNHVKDKGLNLYACSFFETEK